MPRIFMDMPQFPTKIKEQVDYSEIIFRQVDRVNMILSEPTKNLRQLGRAIDALVALTTFIGKIKFDANLGNIEEGEYYQNCINAFESCIKNLNKGNLLFKYRIGGHIGNS